MATKNHSVCAVGSRHAPHNLSYPDAANRIAGTNEGSGIVLSSDNLYQYAVQDDDNSVWMLVDESPITWIAINAALETDDLNDCYDNYGAVAAVVTVDGAEGQGDLRFNTSGAYSIIFNLAGCTGTSDGLDIVNGTDHFGFIRNGANSMSLDADLEACVIDSNASIALNPAPTPYKVLVGGDLEVEGNLTLTSGGTITSTSSGLVRIAANGTGYTVIGSAGTTSHSLNSGNDLLVSGELEIDGAAYLDGALSLAGDMTLTSGGTITSDSNGIIRIAAHGTGYNIIGASATTGQGLATGDDLLIAGILEVQGVAYFSDSVTAADQLTVTTDLIMGGMIITSSNGLLRLAPNGTGYTVIGSAGTTSHGLNSGDDLLVSGELEATGDVYFDTDLQLSGDLYMVNGGEITTLSNYDLSLSANGTGIVNIGNGLSAHSLSGGTSLLVSGELEVTSNSYFDGPIYFGDQGSILDNQAQTNDALQITVGTNSNSLIICQTADAGYDFAHAAETDPTLIIHSANQSTSEYFAERHDQTNKINTIGKGSEQTYHETALNMADEASISFPTDTYGTAGFGRCLMADATGDSVEAATFCWNGNDTVTLLGNTTNVTNADTDGYLCIYASSNIVYIKNRLGGARRLHYEMHYQDGFDAPS